MSSESDVASFRGHTDGVSAAAFFRAEAQVSPNSYSETHLLSAPNSETHLLSASDSGVIRLFDIKSEKCIYAFFNHRAEQYKCLAVCPSVGSPSVGGPSVGSPSVGSPSVGSPSVGGNKNELLETLVLAGNSNGMLYVLSPSPPSL